MADRWLRELERGHELADADGIVRAREQIHDPHARRVRQRPEDRRRRIRLLVREGGSGERGATGDHGQGVHIDMCR
jgi:hypothetical protein